MSQDELSSSRTDVRTSEAATAAELNEQYVARDIPLDLIDPPENPERETMEETELAEMALNIRAVGLIKPLVVKPVGDRYEVIAGHRRFLACTIVKYSPVPCRVKMTDQVPDLAILVAENAHTEPVNPVEEARFYERVLFELCANDVDQLADRTKRRREYLEDRLLLLQGSPAVLAALEQKQLSLAVARELNRVTDPGRLIVFLDAAVQQGASARQVAQWRRDGEIQGALPAAPDGTPGAENNPNNVPLTPFMKCVFCDGTEYPSMMEMLWVHKPCKAILYRMLQRDLEADAGQM